jgi:hypothetical protein
LAEVSRRAEATPGEAMMRFDSYGRFQVEVRRENEAWAVYRAELGKRARLNDVVIPSDLEADDIGTYLDDVFLATPCYSPSLYGNVSKRTR